MFNKIEFFKLSSGNPLDQGDPAQAGGISFSLFAIILLVLLAVWGFWRFITVHFLDLFKIRSLTQVRIWLKQTWETLFAVIIFGSVLAILALFLYKLGL